MKTKIGTEIANVIRDSNTTYKVKGQLIFDVLNSQHTGTDATWRINTVNLQGAEAYCGGLRHSLFCVTCLMTIIILSGSFVNVHCVILAWRLSVIQ